MTAVAHEGCQALSRLWTEAQVLALTALGQLPAAARAWLDVLVLIDLSPQPRVRVLLERPSGQLEVIATLSGDAATAALDAAGAFFLEGLCRLQIVQQQLVTTAQRCPGVGTAVLLDLTEDSVHGCLSAPGELARVFSAAVGPEMGQAVVQ